MHNQNIDTGGFAPPPEGMGARALALVHAFIISAIAACSPIWSIMGTLLCLVVLNLLLDVSKGPKDLTDTLSRAVIKLVAYNLALYVAHILQDAILEGAIPTASVVSSMIAVDEFKRLLQKLELLDLSRFIKLVNFLRGRKDKP